jgi:hypothetical protein
MRAHRLALTLVVLGIAAGCGPEPLPPPAPTSPPPPPEPVGWQPIAVAPEGSRHVRWSLETPAGTLRADPGGMRWLTPPNRKPEHAAAFDDGDPRLITWMEGLGLVAIDQEHHVRVAPRALDALESVGKTPTGTGFTVHVHRGALTAEGDGVYFTRDGKSWQKLADLGDRRLESAVMGADGKGLGLFVPQMLARTEDGGQTWQPVNDGGALVTSLRAARDRVAVEPAPSAAYAQAWSPGKSALDRWDGGSDEEDKSVVRPSFFGSSGSKEPTAKKGAPGEAHRYGRLAERLHEGDGALDGDRFVVVDWAAKGETHIVSGKLGAGATWQLLPEAATPCAKNSSNRRVALCGSRMALACEDNVLVGDVPRGDKSGPITNVRVLARFGSSPRSLAFAGSDRLFVATRDGAKEITVSDKGLEAKAIDVESDKGKVSFSYPQVIASCTPLAGAPAAWIVDASNRALYRHDGARFAKWTGTIDPKTRIEGVRGLDPSGNLLLAIAKGGLAIATAEGALDEIAITWKPTGQAWLGSLTSGRGVLLDERGQARQTEDGGRTWSLVVDPPRLASKGKPGIVCGGDRCEIDDRAVRVGWSREGAPAEKEDPPAKPKPGPPLPSIYCSKLGGRDVQLDPKRGNGILLLPAWSGGGVTAITSLESEKVVKLGAASIDASGKLTARALADMPGEYGIPGEMRGFRALLAPIAGVAAITGKGDFKSGMPASLVWDPGPGKRLVTVKTHAASMGWHQSFVEQVHSMLLGDDGFAMVESSPAQIRFLHESGKVETRDWPNAVFGRLAGHFRGGIARAKDGTWMIAMSAAEPASEGDGDPRVLHLVAIAPDGTRRTRSLFGAPMGTVAIAGVGLVQEGDRFFAVLVEQIGGEEAELRLREIDGDLRLGSARPIPGTRMRLDVIGRLPACGASPTGARMTLREGTYTRLVRVTPQRACAERTFSDEQVIEGAGAGKGWSLDRDAIRSVECSLGP